jgi:hypothetical protein
MAAANTPAYYVTATIVAVKDFIVQTLASKEIPWSPKLNDQINGRFCRGNVIR